MSRVMVVEDEGLVVDARVGADRMRDIIATLQEFRCPAADLLRPVAILDALEPALRSASTEIGLRGQVVTDFRVAAMTNGHVGQLARVFTNLLINAAHALPEHSAHPQVVRVLVEATADDVFVDISDTGAGIAPEVMVRIFEPCFTTKAVGMGTGLGLSIVHAIVHAHGGEVTVTSKLGEGSTFRVRLPRLKPALAPPPARSVARQPAPRRATVLVVDDEVILGRLHRLILEEDYDVVVAASGQQALACIAAKAPDLVLSDLMMPGMTGIELHAALSLTHPALARRMLFTTGGAYTERTLGFVAAMGDRVLSKPISGERLRAAIAAAIAAR